MDPISLIVNSLVTGAIAGLKPTAEKIIKDSYEGLKNFISKKFAGKVKVEQLEQNPESEAIKSNISGALMALDADKDQELINMAEQFLELIKKKDPAIYALYLGEVESRNLKLDNISSENAGGVYIGKATMTEDITISGIHTTVKHDKQNP